MQKQMKIAMTIKVMAFSVDGKKSMMVEKQGPKDESKGARKTCRRRTSKKKVLMNLH